MAEKIYTVAVSYKRRVQAEDDGGAIREASYAVSAQADRGITHLEMRVLGARDIVETPAPTPAEAPAAEAVPQAAAPEAV